VAGPCRPLEQVTVPLQLSLFSRRVVNGIGRPYAIEDRSQKAERWDHRDKQGGIHRHIEAFGEGIRFRRGLVPPSN
jgi:hypothetical protein